MPYRVENIVRNGEIACYKQFLRFSQCFPQLHIFSLPKCGIVWEWVNIYVNEALFNAINSLPSEKISYWSKLKAFAEEKNRYDQTIKIPFRKYRKHCRNRRKWWLPAFSPFPTMFSKAFFLRFVKSRDCKIGVKAIEICVLVFDVIMIKS